MLIRFFLILISLSIVDLIQGQTYRDSLYVKYNVGISLLQDSLSEVNRKLLIKTVFNIQNEAFLLEEQQHDYGRALAGIELAITFWKKLQKETEVANLLKYRGMLLGHLDQFDEAKSSIAKAIDIYASHKMDFGIAVSQFDLGMVYEQEQRIDSAVFWTHNALQYWTTVLDTGRILTLHIQLINLFIQDSQLNKALFIQSSSDTFVRAQEHWYPKLNYYFISKKLFSLTGDKIKFNKYNELYTDLVSRLTMEGKPARTRFE